MIDLIEVSHQFNGEYLFKNVSLKINSNDKIALVGSNGSGKSTLLKIILGEIEPEKGKTRRRKFLKIGYLPQDFISIVSELNLIDEIKNSLPEANSIEQEEKNIIKELENPELSPEEKLELSEKLSRLHEKMNRIDYYSLESQIIKTLIGLGFKEKDFSRKAKEFSGGWRMRIALAKILLQNNDLLLLDEPTNHLDLDSLEWLIEHLKNYQGAIVLISHDKYFIEQTTNKTLEIYNSNISFFNGTYEKYLQFKEERDAKLFEEFERQQKKIKEIERFIERFRYKATKARQVQSRIKFLEKLEKIEPPKYEDEVKFNLPEPPPSEIKPIELISVSKSFGQEEVIKEANLTLIRGDKIAFLGPNGTGKTTLAKIITKRIQPSSGIVNVSPRTVFGYFSQDLSEELNPELDVLETLIETDTDKLPNELRALLGRFLFEGDDVFKKVEILSGGEKSRLALAKILISKANVLILDEPTNHLDISSKKTLQKALCDYKGTLIIISHDIDFLRPIVNKTAEILNKKLEVYDGGIDYYLEKRKEKLANIAAQTINSSTSKSIKHIENIKIDKKEQKRIEAQQRQKKYEATKDLKKEIEVLEYKIAQLEKRKNEIEDSLASPEFYSKPDKLKSLNLEYNTIKKELDQKIEQWTEASEKLEQILKQFE